MFVRRALKPDIPQIRLIIERNFDEVISKEHSQTVVEKFKSHNTKDALCDQLNWKRVYVAELDGQVIATGAFANLSYTNKPRYCVSNLYVLPEYHKYGCGKAIMTKIFEDFIDTGAKSFHVPSTRNAIGFYQSFGFLVDEVQNDLEDEITWMNYTLRS